MTVPDTMRIPMIHRLADAPDQVVVANHFHIIDSFQMPGLRFDSIRGVWSM
jgi:hypothetical protein